MAVRLFLGGLPSGVTPEELAARFAPFGEVTECSVAPPKAYPGVDGTLEQFPREFGHVSLRPKDEAALNKCISAYNGCKWRGGVLKCSLARQHYAERLAAERAGGGGGGEDAAPAAEVRLFPGMLGRRAGWQCMQARACAQPHAAPTHRCRHLALARPPAQLPPLGPGTTLRLRAPKSAGPVEVTLGSGARLDSFPETDGAASVPSPAAAWEPLEAPPCSGYRFEALLQRIAAAPPPELLAAVEARRVRGQALARARELAQQEAAGALGVRGWGGVGRSVPVSCSPSCLCCCERWLSATLMPATHPLHPQVWRWLTST